MKFHTTLRVPALELTVAGADEITEKIRELGYPGPDGWKRAAGDLVWECEFEGDTLAEISERYSETVEEVRCMCGYGAGTWTADPDDPIEYAKKIANDVLEWERHFDGIELPAKMRGALRTIAGTKQEIA